jgi:hypothetical protein
VTLQRMERCLRCYLVAAMPVALREQQEKAVIFGDNSL